MKTYTVIIYNVPEGETSDHVIEAENPTDAALRLRKILKLTRKEMEVVAAIQGEASFCVLDESKVNFH